jgi:hypothetical protein
VGDTTVVARLGVHGSGCRPGLHSQTVFAAAAVPGSAARAPRAATARRANTRRRARSTTVTIEECVARSGPPHAASRLRSSPPLGPGSHAPASAGIRPFPTRAGDRRRLPECPSSQRSFGGDGSDDRECHRHARDHDQAEARSEDHRDQGGHHGDGAVLEQIAPAAPEHLLAAAAVASEGRIRRPLARRRGSRLCTACRVSPERAGVTSASGVGAHVRLNRPRSTGRDCWCGARGGLHLSFHDGSSSRRHHLRERR